MLDPDLGCGAAGAAGLLALLPGMPAAAQVPLLVFRPGFAVVRAALPDGTLSRPETFFAALAASVGLSWAHLGLVLAGVTVAAASGAWWRRNGRPAIRTGRGGHAPTTTRQPQR